MIPYYLIFLWGLPVYGLLTVGIAILGFFGHIDEKRRVDTHGLLVILVIFPGMIKWFDYATPYDTKFFESGNNTLLAFLWAMLLFFNILMALRNNPEKKANHV